MKLSSFVSYITRDMVRQHGTKDILSDENIAFGIIPLAFMEMDRTSNKPMMSNEAYAEKALTDPRFQDMVKLIQHIHSNFNKKNWDTELTLDEKKTILQNSITAILPTLEDLKDNHQYKNYEKNNSDLKVADSIIENLELKMDEDVEVKKILKSLTNIEMNFWVLGLDGKRIYPILSDLLEDVILLEFAFDTDKPLIQKIIEEWKEAQRGQKERALFSNTTYTKIEFIEQVKFKNTRRYLLAEYTRTLNVDEKKLQAFMQHILYYNIGNHKHTPGLGFNIDNIPPRPFLLERTKNIIGELAPVSIPVQS